MGWAQRLTVDWDDSGEKFGDRLDLVRRHQHALGLSEVLARALASRGIGEGQGEDYLAPTLKAQFPDPSSFAGMDGAARLLVDALEQRRRVAVFADYDVDGASSAALIVRWFRAMGREITIYVPDRIIEETQKPGGPAIVYGVVLILLMFVIPNGVGGLFRRIGQLISSRRYSRSK